MNVEIYVFSILCGLFLLIVILLFEIQRSWIKTQERYLKNAHATIEKLQDRLMSKNFDQYKMYDQPIKEYIPPEPEEEMDEFAVGKISGEEIIPDA